MTDLADMSTPVTRGELREELEQLKLQLELRLESRIAPLATKVELEIWGGALLERIKSSEQQLTELIKSNEQQLTELIKSNEQQLICTEQRLHAELARHATALYEAMATLIVASNEKYADLPKRVTRLEAAVFAPEPR